MEGAHCPVRHGVQGEGPIKLWRDEKPGQPRSIRHALPVSVIRNGQQPTVVSLGPAIGGVTEFSEATSDRRDLQCFGVRVRNRPSRCWQTHQDHRFVWASAYLETIGRFMQRTSDQRVAGTEQPPVFPNERHSVRRYDSKLGLCLESVSHKHKQTRLANNCLSGRADPSLVGLSQARSRAGIVVPVGRLFSVGGFFDGWKRTKSPPTRSDTFQAAQRSTGTDS